MVEACMNTKYNSKQSLRQMAYKFSVQINNSSFSNRFHVAFLKRTSLIGNLWKSNHLFKLKCTLVTNTHTTRYDTTRMGVASRVVILNTSQFLNYWIDFWVYAKLRIKIRFTWTCKTCVLKNVLVQTFCFYFEIKNVKSRVKLDQ